MTIPLLRIASLGSIIPRGTIPTPAQCAQVIDAGLDPQTGQSRAYVGGVAVAHEWIWGAREDWKIAQAVYAYAQSVGRPWAPYFATRIDVIGEQGLPGPDPQFLPDWIYRSFAKPALDALRAWQNAGMTVLEGDGRVASRDWIQKFSRVGTKFRPSMYVDPDLFPGEVHITALGVDLRQPAVQNYMATRMAGILRELRNVLGIETAGFLLGVKTGMLCVPWTATPNQLNALGHPIEGPRYLVGGYFAPPTVMGDLYRASLARLPEGAVITNETPFTLTRGALWGSTVPPQVAGEALFV